MMNEDTLRDLLGRIQELDRRGMRYRQGVVTTASPLAVAFGASTTSNTNLRYVSSYIPVVGDVVGTLTFDHDCLVLGTIASSSILSMTLVNGWTDMGVGNSLPRVYKQGNMCTVIAHLNSSTATNVLVYTLPAAWQPAGLVLAPVVYWTGTAVVAGACYIYGSNDAVNAGQIWLYGVGHALVAATFWAVNVVYPLAA
jgi:hypothetical protein